VVIVLNVKMGGPVARSAGTDEVQQGGHDGSATY
jgi:hypothetical protein